MEALKHMLDERKKAAERRETMDFLDLVVDELKEKPVLDEDFCLDVLFGLLFASIHTTSTALTAALKFLTDNPKALQELAVSKCIYTLCPMQNFFVRTNKQL
jgi:cytochrome P450